MSTWRKAPRLGIFISYRKKEIAHAARLYDWLSQRYQGSSEHVFMDFVKIRAGGDWAAVIESNLAQCNVCVAVIGEEWLKIMAERNADRESEDDVLRRELATALDYRKVVIPFVVHPVQDVPTEQQLPPSLKDLPKAHAVFAHHARWREAIDELVASFADLPPIPGKASGEEIVRLFEADDDPPTSMGRTRTSLQGDIDSGRWRTQMYPVQDGPPPNPNWLLVKEFVELARGVTPDSSAKKVEQPVVGDSGKQQPLVGTSGKRRLTGREIVERASRGEAPKMVGRTGGLSGQALTGDISSGSWRDQSYEVSDDETERRNWFPTELFLERIRSSEHPSQG